MSSNEHDLEQAIRERAFQIWVEQGQPYGRHEEHWQQAKAELVSGTAPPLQPELRDGGEGKSPEKGQKAMEGGVSPDELRR